MAYKLYISVRFKKIKWYWPIISFMFTTPPQVCNLYARSGPKGLPKLQSAFHVFYFSFFCRNL